MGLGERLVFAGVLYFLGGLDSRCQRGTAQLSRPCPPSDGPRHLGAIRIRSVPDLPRPRHPPDGTPRSGSGGRTPAVAAPCSAAVSGTFRGV